MVNKKLDKTLSLFTSLASLRILCISLPALHSPCHPCHTGCSQSLWRGDGWCRMLGSGHKSFHLSCFVFIPLFSAAPPFLLLCMTPPWAAVLLKYLLRCGLPVGHRLFMRLTCTVTEHSLLLCLFCSFFILRILPFFNFLLPALQTGQLWPVVGLSQSWLEPSETGCIYHKAAAGLVS